MTLYRQTVRHLLHATLIATGFALACCGQTPEFERLHQDFDQWCEDYRALHGDMGQTVGGMKETVGGMKETVRDMRGAVEGLKQNQRELKDWLRRYKHHVEKPQTKYSTANFVVHAPDAESAKRVAQWSEHCRTQHWRDWLGKDPPDWSQPATIRFRTGGNGGSTWYSIHGGEVFGFDGSWQGNKDAWQTVIPHEVMHMVLASEVKYRVPRWLDEGIASSVEAPSEQNNYWRSAKWFLGRNRALPVLQLCRRAGMDYLPMQDDRGCLIEYAQGVTLVTMLLERPEGREGLIELARLGKNRNWEAAFKSVYGLSCSEVDALWRSWMSDQPTEGHQHRIIGREQYVFKQCQWVDCPDGSCGIPANEYRIRQQPVRQQPVRQQPVRISRTNNCDCKQKFASLTATINELQSEIETLRNSSSTDVDSRIQKLEYKIDSVASGPAGPQGPPGPRGPEGPSPDMTAVNEAIGNLNHAIQDLQHKQEKPFHIRARQGNLVTPYAPVVDGDYVTIDLEKLQ